MAIKDASRDAFISEDFPSKPCGDTSTVLHTDNGDVNAWQVFWVARGSAGNDNRILIDFDLSDIPVTATINSAKIRLYQYDGLNDWITSSHSIKLRATLIEQTWTQTTVSWNTRPDTDGSYIGPETVSFYNRISSYIEIDVKTITQHYIENPTTYYGYMLYYDADITQTRKEFYSTNSTSTTKHPVLILTYSAVVTPETDNNPPVWPANSAININPPGVLEIGTSLISVYWNTATDPDVGDSVYYVVKRSINNGAGDEIYNGASTSFNDEDILSLSPRTSIKYLVYATDYKKNSPILTSRMASINKYIESTASYSYYFDPVYPSSVKKLIFTENPDPTTNTAYLTFQHNPLSEISFLRMKAESTNLALTVQNSSLSARKAYITNEMTNMATNISLYMTNKANYIDTFEKDMYSYVKEGTWTDSSYVLKRIKTTISSPALTLTPTSISGFIMPLTWPLTNLSSIKLWLMGGDEYLYQYERYADYDIEYGIYLGLYGIVFKPLVDLGDSGAFKYNMLSGTGHDTRLSAVTEITISCSDVDGTAIEDTLLPKLTVDSYTRTYTINDFNPQLSSLEIITQQDEVDGEMVDRDPLVQDTDYTYVINEDNTGTITFKPSQNALHSFFYYSISYYNNVTVKSFYADAEDALAKAAYPVISYEILMADLSALPGFETFIPVVGKRILINDSNLKLNGIYGYISAISYDLDNPENTKITVTNYENIGTAQQIAVTAGGGS